MPPVCSKSIRFSQWIEVKEKLLPWDKTDGAIEGIPTEADVMRKDSIWHMMEDCQQFRIPNSFQSLKTIKDG